jgi:hypothetical protein
VAPRLLYLVVLTAAAGAGLRAHHSIAGVYDSSQSVTIDGAVAEFAFVNPHPYVVVEAAEGAGPPQSWRLELDNRFELVAAGMSADTLKPGDRVRVTGSRARNGTRGLYVRRLDRPADGFRYEQVGASPRIRTSS